MKKIVFLLLAILLAGCGGGGGGGGSSSSSQPTAVSFYVFDFVQEDTYTIAAEKVGEGTHCYIYLERGQSVDSSVVESLASAFDDAIYPGVTAAFGSEPNPGVDGDSKIYILLMDIVDGLSGGSYIAGYFDPYNEYSVSDSNRKEIFFMDVDPGIPSSSTFKEVLAHEFQHMIHWEQKTNLRGLTDNTWLDEAMSEVAPYFAGYGGSYDRVYTFEIGNNRSDSLTTWSGELADYAVVYMWAQYMVDRFPDNVFLNILANDKRGWESVEKYLKTQNSGFSFPSVFRDWSIAVFSGSDVSATDNADLAYKTIDTRKGVHGGYSLPGMFTASNKDNTALPSLTAWSIDMYWYSSLLENPAFTWTGGGTPTQASFYDNSAGTLTFDMVSGTSYDFQDTAILILQNAGGGNTSSASATNSSLVEPSLAILSPAAKLSAVAESASGKSLATATGKPTPVCVHDFLADREKKLRRRLQESEYAR